MSRVPGRLECQRGFRLDGLAVRIEAGIDEGYRIESEIVAGIGIKRDFAERMRHHRGDRGFHNKCRGLIRDRTDRERRGVCCLLPVDIREAEIVSGVFLDLEFELSRGGG